MTNEERENYCYIGDGVYAFFDGYGILLTTGNHDENKCDNKIYLEPNVLSSLNRFFLEKKFVEKKKEECKSL